MKRGYLLKCADMSDGRLKVLKQRDQIPLMSSQGDTEEKRANHSLNDCFLLRALCDLIGGEEGAELAAVGISPSLAAPILSNLLTHASNEGVDVTAPGTFAAVVVMEETGADGAALRFVRWFCNDLSTFPAWLAFTEQREAATTVRVIMVNTARAAAFVRQRAQNLNLPEAGDPITGTEA